MFYWVGDPLIEKLCSLVCGSVVAEVQAEVERNRQLVETWEKRGG